MKVNDHPGFVSNRVLMPMINEAVLCLQEGVAEAEAIDEVMKLGMAHPMGPLRLADLIGLDVCYDIMMVLYRDLGQDKYYPAPLLKKMVVVGAVGQQDGTRVLCVLGLRLLDEDECGDGCFSVVLG